MDERFPGNAQQPRAVKGPREETAEPTKNIVRVAEGEVIRRKRPMSKRFKEAILGGDSKSVGEYVLLDVLIPAIRDMISDAATTSIERMVYGGDVRPHGRRPSQRVGGGLGHTRYDRMGSSNRREDPRDREPMSRRARAQHDFDEVILSTRVEADEILTQMYDLLEKFDAVSVADLYELSGISSNHVDHRWGWVDLTGSGITRTRSGYLLDLPRPEPLKD